jgi:hypothetical protein
MSIQTFFTRFSEIEVVYQELNYTDYFSLKIFLRAFRLMSVSLTYNKQQATLGYQMKNEAAGLSRIGLNLICNSVFARAWKFGTLKAKNHLKATNRLLHVFSE